jgi:hypothetical protein
MDIPKGTPIKVTWLDADCEAGWCQHDDTEEDNLPDSAYLVSVGVFVSKGPKFLTISFSYNEEAGDFLGKHRIPVGMIKEIIELGEKDHE